MIISSAEANAAAEVKNEKPIMVVLGNPPYSGHSANKGDWIRELLRDYYQVDGASLKERNPKWLQDDYVKFIRFGQWRIEQNGEGVLAFITNHSWLDNPTFRGMRQSLLNSFSEIYVLNLHGNSKKKGGPRPKATGTIMSSISSRASASPSSSSSASTAARRACSIATCGACAARNMRRSTRATSRTWTGRNSCRNRRRISSCLLTTKAGGNMNRAGRSPTSSRCNSVGIVNTAVTSSCWTSNGRSLRERIARFRDRQISDDEIKSTIRPWRQGELEPL